MSRQTQINSGKVRAGEGNAGAGLPEPVWRLRPLVLTHLAAIVLVASWILPVSRRWWDQLDVAVFRLLNGSLGLGEGWQMFWALANHRLTDLLSGALMLLLFVSWLWGRPRDVQNMKCASLGALAPLMGVVILFLHPFIIKWIGYARPSPTLVLDGVLWLSELVPSIEAKIADRSSFPGDHAFILVSFALFFMYLGPRRVAVTASMLALVFILPRLVGGAHWLTDDVIGGAIPALLVVSWLLATPLGYYMARMLLPLVRVFIALIPERLRIPERRGS